MGNSRWQTKKWISFFNSNIKTECEICHKSDVTLQLHHKNKLPPYLFHWRFVANNLFLDENQAPIFIKSEDPYKFTKACPNCKRGTFNKRKILKPTFCCIKCHFEFDKPLQIPHFKNIINPLFKSWSNENKDKITKIVNDIRDNYYYNPKYVITVCLSCHKRLENGFIICNKCHINWHSIKYKTCYECYMEHKRKMLEDYSVITNLDRLIE